MDVPIDFSNPAVWVGVTVVFLIGWLGGGSKRVEYFEQKKKLSESLPRAATPTPPTHEQIAAYKLRLDKEWTAFNRACEEYQKNPEQSELLRDIVNKMIDSGEPFVLESKVRILDQRPPQ